MSEPKIQLCWRNEKDIGTKKKMGVLKQMEREQISHYLKSL